MSRFLRQIITLGQLPIGTQDSALELGKEVPDPDTDPDPDTGPSLCLSPCSCWRGRVAVVTGWGWESGK